MNNSKIPVVILVRVSTQKQETDRQISELRAYADSKGYDVLEMCKETISGRADEGERQGLIRAEELARFGKIKKVLVHEVSRLARKNSITHRFVETLEECGVSLYWHSQGFETLLPNGKRNPAAGIMLALLAVKSSDDENQVWDENKWQIIQCGGCGTISFRDVYWFSENEDENGNVVPTVRLYPQSKIDALPKKPFLDVPQKSQRPPAKPGA